MFSNLKHTFGVMAIFFLNIEPCICACARAEYEINGECCPMCSPGSIVYRHCTELISTTCLQCTSSTYMDEPNGLPNCISCTVCDAGQGLRVKTGCTQTSNTVCEPLEAFYCTDEHRGNCRHAVEHTKCSPGQYIKQKGTALKDAECAECTEGTYSNGALQICKQHTKCEDSGLKEITPGTNYLDAQCGQDFFPALIAGILVAIAVLLAATICIIRHKKCRTRADTVNKMGRNQPHENFIVEESTYALHQTDHAASPM